MALGWNRWSRKLHRWGAIVTLVPLLIVIVSGLLLQVKKQVTWIQPPTSKGIGSSPEIDWQQVLKAGKSVDQAEISNWSDVDRIDVRPRKGIAKIQSNNSWEVQVDLVTGEVLASSYRRSDWIESIHDGSFFFDGAKLWLFLPNGIVLLGLWFTGAYLWWLPIGAKRKRKIRQAQSAQQQVAEKSLGPK